jgi:uncharacterized protein (DUF3084 family)
MTSAYILVTAILILGGVIASLGDRLGSKVGKARLRLFNLRPRQTAILVTVLTGTLISASTLGIIFTLSESLRQGVFELDDIKEKRREVQRELDRVLAEKETIETELKGAEKEKEQTYKRLKEARREFKLAKTQLTRFSQQAKALAKDVRFLVQEKQQLIEQRNELQRQSLELRAKLQQQNLILAQREKQLSGLEETQKKLQIEIGQRDNLIVALDQAIAAKDQDLTVRTSRLKELESQLEILRKEVAVLEDYYQTYQELRERRIALVKGQVLAFGVVRVLDPSAVKEAIDSLLRNANRYAIEATIPNNPEVQGRVVQISQAQVEQLSKQLEDGREYVVRIISAGNYVQGEKAVVVFADIVLNQVIYQEGELLATVSIDGDNLTPKALQEKLDLLIAASQFRSRRAGVLGDFKVADGRITTLVAFIEELSQSTYSFDELRAVVMRKTYTSGPINLTLEAVKNGEVIFSTSK